MPESALLKKDLTGQKDEFYYHVVNGLARKNKSLHPKYFYDKQGSAYFDQICDLEEYYPYKVELSLLPQVAVDLPSFLEGQYVLIEFGAGSLLKVKPILQEIKGIKRFIPIDISGEHLRKSCRELEIDFPGLDVFPVVGDFSQPVKIKDNNPYKKIGFFPGSTIGNFTPDEAHKFLAASSITLGKDSYLIVGVDTKKSPARLHSAYNDKLGVTAKFNLNILDRINCYFGDAINTDKFEHYAYYNVSKGRVEMHLVCLESHSIYLDDVQIFFEEGESIHTENSYKYSPGEFKTLAKKSGWHVKKLWLATDDMFSIFLLHHTG